ncbi:uncharacterized protein LOC113324776 [Papaver somniferum]|uniref:uncharacterized protein LOC113324776 n=1 Tax=Papaver somniferum TaxID=3469 RepID=UPI000E6F48C0|nr:uncharacterized protein LOC113324776 [Papaver somniferum]
MKVADLLSNGNWSIPPEAQSIFSALNLPEGGNDEIIWNASLSGEFLVSAAVNKMRFKEGNVRWSKYLWNSYLHPSIASNVWKLIYGLYMDDEKMVSHGYDMVSQCCICENAEHNMHHLFWECDFSSNTWNWLVGTFQFAVPTSFEDIWKSAINKSPLVQQVWITTACSTMKELWFQKNRFFFDNIKPNISSFNNRIMKMVFEGGMRITWSKWNHIYDLNLITFFNMSPRKSKIQFIKPCYWFAPEADFTLFYCDGASLENPGAGGLGVVVRNHLCRVMGAISGGLGTATNYIPEVYAVVVAAELVVDWELQKIIIHPDSKTVLNQFACNQIPWFIKVRWYNVVKNLIVIRLAHCFREINFSDDCAAKRGARLLVGEINIYIGRPSWLGRVETLEVVYYRFC